MTYFWFSRKQKFVDLNTLLRCIKKEGQESMVMVWTYLQMCEILTEQYIDSRAARTISD